MVPRPGFEPGTFRLGGGRSIQLSYRGAAVAIIPESPDNFPPAVIADRLTLKLPIPGAAVFPVPR
jgi:hypothetical protein